MYDPLYFIHPFLYCWTTGGGQFEYPCIFICEYKFSILLYVFQRVELQVIRYSTCKFIKTWQLDFQSSSVSHTPTSSEWRLQLLICLSLMVLILADMKDHLIVTLMDISLFSMSLYTFPDIKWTFYLFGDVCIEILCPLLNQVISLFKF